MRKLLHVLSTLVLLSASFAQGQGVDSTPSSSPPAAVAQAYLYLEPFQARVEALFDMPTVLRWLEMPDDPAQTIDAAKQQAVQDGMMKLAREWCRVQTDERDAPGTITGTALVKGKPGQTMPMAEGEQAAAKDLMLGVMYEFAIPGSPSRVELRWAPFLPPVRKLPLTIFFGNSTEQQDINAGYPVVRWNNKDRLPHPQPLAVVPKLPLPVVYDIPLAMGLWVLFGLVVFGWMTWRDKKFPGGITPFLAAWLVGIGVTCKMNIRITDPYSVGAVPIETPAQADKVLQPLLKNVYRAFDYRAESDIYDRLARSVDGELLRNLYLQTVQALTLDGREGARVRVTDLSVNVDKVKRVNDGFEAEGEWTALGTVGHWGHQHQRVNRYKAKLTLRPVGNEWKMVAMEVLEERRL